MSTAWLALSMSGGWLARETLKAHSRSEAISTCAVCVRFVSLMRIKARPFNSSSVATTCCAAAAPAGTCHHGKRGCYRVSGE